MLPIYTHPRLTAYYMYVYVLSDAEHRKSQTANHCYHTVTVTHIINTRTYIICIENNKNDFLSNKKK